MALVIKRMPAEDDRKRPRGRVREAADGKDRICRDHADVEARSRSFCLRWLIRVRQAGVDGRIHKRRLHRSRRCYQAGSKTVVP